MHTLTLTLTPTLTLTLTLTLTHDAEDESRVDEVQLVPRVTNVQPETLAQPILSHLGSS